MPYREDRTSHLRWPARARGGRPGTLELLPDVLSPQLKNERDLLVYLPASHGEEGRRFPVIYMHDGQNLFDPATSFSGEWQVDESMAAASLEGLEAIVVGVPNMREKRMNEYSPFDGPDYGPGRGDAYLDFLTQTVKPIIDRRFRTLTERRHTGIAGSSMGGLISLYAFFARRQTFGFTAVMSPSLWLGGEAIFPIIEEAPFVPGRIYLDIGRQEGERHVANVRRLRDLLQSKGYEEGMDLRWIEDEVGHHNEAAWAHRFRAALPYLLAAQGERRSRRDRPARMGRRESDLRANGDSPRDE
jgi:predicted alpha/beta superfamily hydrolase